MPMNANAKQYLEIEVKTASPTELVVLLYDGAIGSLQSALHQMAAGNIQNRVQNINKALAILTELQAALNFETGGDISVTLDRLYNYMRDRLFKANRDQDPAPLREVLKLMTGLRSAWVEVARKQPRPGLQPAAAPRPAEDLPHSALGSQAILRPASISLTA